MRYSVTFTAIIGATSVAAFPVSGPVAALRERGIFGTIGNYFTGGGSTSTPPAQAAPVNGINPVEDALNNVIGGGALQPQVMRLMQDGQLGQNTLATIAKRDTAAKVKTLLKDKKFLSRAGALMTDDAFIGQMAILTTNTHAASQALKLAGSTKYLGFTSGVVRDKDIFKAVTGALTSSGFDLGEFMTGRVQSKNVWDLAGSVSGGSVYASKFKALFADKIVAQRFDALVKSNGNFAGELTSAVEDNELVTRVCGILGVSPELTDKTTALLSGGANFGESLEAMMGAGFAGQITGLIGTGSAGSLIGDAFGGLGSIEDIMSGYLSSGAIVSAVGSLLGSTAITGKSTALLNGFVAGTIDLSAIVKDVTADLGFVTKITGAFGIPVVVVQKCVTTVMGSGFFDVAFGFFDMIY
ncbi:hypothetical protein MN608_03303 [Microdochium nivale]|nr:hypothetical protein MN608_03303 [Microdochium nivale]